MKLWNFRNRQLGNKADLIHLRQVSTDEGEILAKDFDCKFYEISAAEQVQQVSDAFLDLCREILQAKRKSKQSFIDKIDRMFTSGRVYARGKSDSAAISKEWKPIISYFQRLWSLPTAWHVEMEGDSMKWLFLSLFPLFLCKFLSSPSSRIVLELFFSTSPYCDENLFFFRGNGEEKTLRWEFIQMNGWWIIFFMWVRIKEV